MRQLPAGTVTFLFTDVEGSTRLLHELGDRYAEVLAEHRRVLRDAFARHGGTEVDTQGDAFFVAFAKASDALAAAAQARDALEGGPVRVRVGVHTGEPLVTEEGYVGIDVHRAARIAAAGHGGQILVSQSTRELVGTDALRDLGEHRLKDLTAPERIYQLGGADFPPLKSLDATNLPVAASPLVGRERELDELLGLLRDGSRVVTVTGTGGTGKTRLALQAAAELVGTFDDGVFWVPLAGLRDADLFLPSVAQAVGARDDLVAYFASRSTLLLLDNFEHLLEAAPALSSLLAAAPGLRVLVTSRAPLRINGEHEFVLDPLSEREAVTLFIDRARATGRTLEPDSAVEQICRRLDGLPLALELAAARTKVLDPSALLARLDKRLPVLTGGRRDAPERQRTLRATIEWSHDLLDDQARPLFARLSVFAGTFSFAAAEEVADADLDTLASLVDLSLLKPTGADRFLMLETIREYAAERVDEAEALRRAHAGYYLELAEVAAPQLLGTTLGTQLDLLEQEHDNLRAALDWLESAEGDLAVRLTAALGRFWFIRGYAEEARKRLDTALRLGRDPTAARASVLRSAASFALDEPDPAKAERYAKESVEISRGLGDRHGAARSLLALAQSAVDKGEFGRACSLAEESVRLFQELGEEDLLRNAWHEYGWMSFAAGRIEQARAIHEENLERARDAGDLSVEAASRELLALIAAREGRTSQARAMLAESYRINRGLGYSFMIAFDLDYLAAAVATERPVLAARLLGRAEALREEIGARIRRADEQINEQTLRAIRSQLAEPALTAAWEDGRKLDLDDAVALGIADVDSS